MGSIRTHWMTASGAPPFVAGQRFANCGSPMDLSSSAVPGNVGVASGETLLDLIGQSFARGHYKVALRRSLMYAASGHRLPDSLVPLVKAACRRCCNSELEAMWQAALRWAHMVTRDIDMDPVTSRRLWLTAEVHLDAVRATPIAWSQATNT